MDGRAEEILEEGEVVGKGWKVEGKIGGGGFGQVFKAVEMGDERREVAVKVELSSGKQVLRIEAFILKRYQGCQHAPTYLEHGTTPNYNFLVMSLLSRNLSELRRDSPTQRFSRRTTFHLGIQSLEALRDFHALRLLHRDVKPSNFALGIRPTDCHLVYMLDFGLARVHLDETGRAKSPRENAGFRGTVRYASLSAHDKVELGRKDDLWSWLYMLVEMGRGILPWRRIREKTEVGRWKKRCGPEQLFTDMPKDMIHLYEHLKGLSYAAKPDYARLERTLQRMWKEAGGAEEEEWDWEEGYATASREEATRTAGKKEALARTYVQDTRAEQEGPPSLVEE